MSGIFYNKTEFHEWDILQDSESREWDILQ